MERRLAYELAKKKQRQEKDKISNLEFMLDSLCTCFSLTGGHGLWPWPIAMATGPGL